MSKKVKLKLKQGKVKIKLKGGEDGMPLSEGDIRGLLLVAMASAVESGASQNIASLAATSATIEPLTLATGKDTPELLAAEKQANEAERRGLPEQ